MIDEEGRKNAALARLWFQAELRLAVVPLVAGGDAGLMELAQQTADRLFERLLVTMEEKDDL